MSQKTREREQPDSRRPSPIQTSNLSQPHQSRHLSHWASLQSSHDIIEFLKHTKNNGLGGKGCVGAVSGKERMTKTGTSHQQRQDPYLYVHVHVNVQGGPMVDGSLVGGVSRALWSRHAENWEQGHPRICISGANIIILQPSSSQPRVCSDVDL